MYNGCAVVRLAAAGRLPGALLTPFDRLERIAPAATWRRASWPATLRTIGRSALGAGGLPEPSRLDPSLQVLDWQLEAALALRQGRAPRVLIADAVGLGKTVQAGWCMALLTDPHTDGVLVLTPAGLRDQWRAELGRRFGICATVIDAARFRELRQSLPATISPWSLPGVFITAIDFAKQPEVLAGLLGRRWSLVVLDEAHNLTRHTDRRHAADLVARGADHVVLLTATPHPGDAEAFQEIRRIGGVPGEAMLTLRRSRADVQLASARRTRTLRIAPTPAERRLHLELRQYLRRLRRERVLDRERSGLIASVLLKRAASSAEALRRTLARRRSAIAEAAVPAWQDTLPFGAPGECDEGDERVPDGVDEPAFGDRLAEVAALDRLLACAHVAAGAESKLAAVLRLLRRVREPAVVFTEYRDTLHHLAAMLPGGERHALLHGGLTRAERRDALRAFTSGSARVLVATDAAGEGLNLHHTCRLVINIDLPWTPTTLEQRVGRVDRIGQRAVVHALRLIGGSPGEALLARRLRMRLERIRRDLDRLAPGSRDHSAATPVSPLLHLLSSGAALVRVAAPTRPGRRPGRPRRGVPWVAVSTRRRLRLGLPQGVLLVYGVQSVTAGGTVHTTGVALMVRTDRAASRKVGVRALLRACDQQARSAAAAAAEPRLHDAHHHLIERLAAVVRRLRSSVQQAGRAPAVYQPGLFDRRAMHEALRARAAADRCAGALQADAVRLAGETAAPVALPPQVVAALVLD